jgi:hypothetical protein
LKILPNVVQDEMTNETPAPPDSLPNYVTDAVERQGPERLHDLAAWAVELADAKEAAAERDLEDTSDVEDGEKLDSEKRDADEVEEVDAPSGTTVYVHRIAVDCGPGCDGCPHGPYRYAKWRDGDTVRTEYLGK